MPPSGAQRRSDSYGAPRHVRGAFLRLAWVAPVLVALSCGGCGYLQRESGTIPTASELPPDTAPPVEDVVPAYGGVPWVAPMIRVGLAQGVPGASVSGRGSYIVRQYGQSLTSRTEGPGEESRFSAHDLDAGTIRISPEGAEPLEFDGTGYRGEIEIFASGPGSLTVVNVVDLESYIRGVLPGEIGSRPADGSSKNRNSGSGAMARANPARLRMPPLISEG